MADRITPEQRSRNMRHVHGKDTKPEVFIRKLLFSEGYRYRIHSTKIPGHPDIWLKKYNTAIYIHGCFWHRHQGCKYATEPATNYDFWDAKFKRNIERDKTVKTLLAERKIKCLVIWECSIKRMKKCSEAKASIMRDINSFMDSDMAYMEI